MRIAFDVTWMEASNTSGGGYQYAHRLISTLAAQGGHVLFPVVTKAAGSPFENLPNTFVRVWNGLPSDFYWILKADRIDLVHAPVQCVAYFPRAMPLVTSIHDLQHEYFPEFFTAAELAYRARVYPRIAARSSDVVVSFEFAKRDVIRFLGIPETRITVCPLGTERTTQCELPLDTALLERYGVRAGEYLFYSANTWPHKNHATLIRALAILKSRYGRTVRLVCTGQHDGATYDDEYRRLQALIAAEGMERAVVFTGYIAEHEKNTLLENAALAVIPTLYEAGCFPLLEAMSRGVPVICSNVTALPEQIGDARFIFDPHDADAIAALTERMLTDPALRDANVCNSRRQVQGTTWEEVAPKFVEVYQTAVSRYAKRSALRRRADRWIDRGRELIGRARQR